MTLLPFGQKVKIIHKFMEFETGWITNTTPSYFAGHGWQYEIRTDKRLRSGDWLWGGEWFDEKDLIPIENGSIPKCLNINTPESWPPKMNIGRRPGIWGINGAGVNQVLIDKMLSWNPGAITCFYDYLQANGVDRYVDKYSNVPVIIRFQHDKNWHENPSENAKNKSVEIISKWNDIKNLNPYVYFANEMNLHYENGDDNQSNQHLWQTPEFYQKYSDWVTELADRIKQEVPEMNLVCPPFAYGHDEDGVPENGVPKIGWCGYDYLTGYADGSENTIEKYFSNVICGHYYWGNAGGSNQDWLYDEDSKWHAFRWRKVLELFKVRYDMDVKMIIDECGNFATDDNDFTEQLVYYANETLADSRIIAMTYFLFDDPTNSPGNMPNSWQVIPELNVHLVQMKNMPDIAIVSDNEPNPEPLPEPPPLPEPEPEPEPPEENRITMEISYSQSNLPLLVGNYVYKSMPIIVQPPYGNSYTVISGSKSAYGNGGFEAGYAHMKGDYILTIEGEEYIVPCEADGSQIFVTFTISDNEPEEKVILKSIEISASLADEIMETYPDIFTVSGTMQWLQNGMLRL